MLYLHPPYYLVRGITLFPDHLNDASRKQFYYLPLRPRLGWGDADGKPVPDFQLLKYVDDAPDAPKGGAFLSLGVDLGVDDALLAEVRRELAEREKVDEKALSLSPVPLTDGAAQLMLFGAKSGDAGGGRFVTRIDQAARPALFGNNAAVFSVSLDREGAILAEQSLEGKRSPLGVVYALHFNALKPAWRVKVSADWTQVAESFERQARAKAFFAQAELRAATQSLVDGRVIRIEPDAYMPEAEAKGALDGMDTIVTQLTDMVVQRFFEPRVNPAAPKADLVAGIVDGATRVLDTVSGIFATGGGLSFGYSESRAKVSLSAKLDAEVVARTTVRMTASPQAYLDGLMDAVRRAGLEPGNFVRGVVLRDDFFRRRRVSVVSRADHAGNGIASIVVRLAYGGDERTVTLAESGAPVAVSWPAALDGRRMRREVRVSYTVNFVHDELAGQRPAQLSTPERPFTGDDLEIFPYHDLFLVRSLPIEAAAGFPWDRYPVVEVGVRYADEANAISIERTVRLSRDSPAAKVRLFVRDFRRTGYEARIRFVGDAAAGVGDEARGWTAMEADAVEVRDPLPHRRVVRFYADDVDWDAVRRVRVDARYDDPAHGISARRALELTRDAPEREMVVHVADPARADVGYDLRVVKRGGEVETIAGSLTRGDEVYLGGGARVTGRRPVRVSLEPGAPRHPRITVELRHRDAAEGVGSTRTIEFSRTKTEGAEWSFPFSSESEGAYEYRVRWYGASGLVAAQYPVRPTDFASATDPDLVVPLAPKR